MNPRRSRDCWWMASLPKLDGGLGGRMASATSSFPIVNKKLPSAAFPLASNSYDWILQDSRAKASTSGVCDFLTKWRMAAIKVMFSSFLFRVSALVRPLLRRHESPQDGLRLLAGGKINQIKRPVWGVKINKSVSWPKYYEYEALSWRSMMSLSTNNCDILSTW